MLRSFLCFVPEHHICNALGSLGFIFYDDMAVKTFGGSHVGVSELL